MNPTPKFDHLLDVPVQFEALLKGKSIRIGELLELKQGSLIGTPLAAGETVEVFAAGSPLGVAELTEFEGRRAVRMVSFHAGNE
jgi:flagellar motor switch/type III secretory pathway protein FliN